MLRRFSSRRLSSRSSSASALLRFPPGARALSSYPAVGRRCRRPPDPVAQLDLFNPTPEHAALRVMVRHFAESEVEPTARARDAEERFDRRLHERCGELGLLGVTVPEKYGGSGLDAVAACIVHEELSAVDPGMALSYLAHSMLFANNLARNGNEAAKARHLPAACSGKAVGGMCMSEPGYGTDVLGMQSTAKKQADGSFVLNGAKMWITNGTVDDARTLGDVFLVYAATGPKQVSLFLVEKGQRGFSVGQRIKGKCGMRASPTAELVFDNVHVPAANLVSKEGGAVLCMMKNLEIERVTLGAMSTGLARRCFEVANKYASERVAFGKPIREFGQIQRHLAESYARYVSARTYLYYTAARMDLDKEGQRLDTDGVKLICTTMGKDVADNCMQVLGGAGYIADHPIERLWRDSKLLEIGGGTLESHHKNMTRELRGMDKLH
jgi:isovaleryl-CoA dehydrogenase